METDSGPHRERRDDVATPVLASPSRFAPAPSRWEGGFVAPIAYSLTWPSQLVRGWRAFRGDPTLSPWLKRQQLLLLGFAIALGALSPRALILWIAMIYLRWP